MRRKHLYLRTAVAVDRFLHEPARPPRLHPSSTFQAVSGGPSGLKGKLRKHTRDPRQFQWDNGDSFIHIGETGYRWLVKAESQWRVRCSVHFLDVISASLTCPTHVRVVAVVGIH